MDISVCSICHEELFGANAKYKTIQCGHIFCSSCLVKYDRQPRGNYCPVCSARIILQTELFPTKKTVVSFQETLQSLNEVVFGHNDAEAKMNDFAIKLTEDHDEFVDDFITLGGNILQLNKEFEAMEEEANGLELAMNGWKDEYHRVLGKLKKQKKIMKRIKASVNRKKWVFSSVPNVSEILYKFHKLKIAK